MKMKNKLPKEKQGNSLNESSSTFVEPSFSKITFRKRGHDNILEKLSDIGEEEGIWSKALDFGPTDELYQSNWQGNNPEYPKAKKKRKKKKDVYEQCSDSVSHEVNVSKEGCTDVKGDEDRSIIELGAQFESSELNYSVTYSNDPQVHKKKKKKKKENVSENPSHKTSLSNEYFTERNEDEEPVVESGVKSNELNFSVSNTDGSEVLNKKKKKKKHLSDDPSNKLNLSKEGFKDVKTSEESNELNYSVGNTDSPNFVNEKKKKTKHLSDDPSDKLNLSKEGFKDVKISAESNELNYSVGNTDSPNFVKKKKKKHLSDDPSNKLNLSKEGFKDEKISAESKELNYSVGNTDGLNFVNKKKKKRLSDDPSNKLNLSKEGFKDMKISEESNELNYSVGNTDSPNFVKKKKKKHLSDDPSNKLNLSKEGFKDEKISEESNELNYSVGNTDSPNFRNKKKKKHLPDDPLHKLNLNKDIFKDVKVSEDKVEDTLRAESPVKKFKTKHNKPILVGKEHEICSLHYKNSPLSKENPSIKQQQNNSFEIISDVNLENLNNEEFSGRVETFLNSRCKEHKKKHSQSGKNVIEICNSIDSPSLKNKKKAQKLTDESNLNISSNDQIQKERSGPANNLVVASNDLIQLNSHDTDSFNFPFLKKKKAEKLLDEINLNMSNNEQFQNDRRDTENNEVEVCNYLNISQAVQSAKKLKRKHKSSENFDTKHESLMNKKKANADGIEIKSSDTECSPIKNTINKERSSEMFLAETKPSLLVPNSPKTKLENSGKFENNSQLNKKPKKHKNPLKNSLLISNLDLPNRDNNKESDERKSKHLKSLAPGLKEMKCEKKKNKQPKKSILFEDELRTICAVSVKPDSNNSITVAGPSESKHKNEKSNAREEVDIKQNLPSPKKKKKIKNDIESLRNQLLKEALSGIEKSGDLPPKSTKLKTGVEGNVKTLRKCLLKEAISGTKEAEDLPQKSSKPKTGVEENVDSLRKRLLKEALGSSTKGAEDLPQKSSKSKTGVEENVDSLRKRLLKEALGSSTKGAEDLPQKSSKSKTGVEENVDSLRKRLLKEASGSSTKGAEDLPKKSCKVKTGVEENVDTLRKRLLKEASGSSTKGAEDLPKKSCKVKTGVEENVDTLRKRLLIEAISGPKGAEDLPPKSSKPKTGVGKRVEAFLLNKVQKDTKEYCKNLKDKLKIHKRKHKYKSNDIDLLTDNLISKALEKVSRSSASHSSQENINSLNVEAKDVEIKKNETSENKIVRVKKLKSNLSEHKPIDVQDQKSKHISEREKMQKALLNNATGNINPGFRTSKSKLKRKALSASEKCISENISKRKKEKTTL